MNNSEIYDTYKELYLSEKEHVESLPQDIQLANGLKARTGAKKQMLRQQQLQPNKMQLRRLLPKGLQYLQILNYSSILYVFMDSRKI